MGQANRVAHPGSRDCLLLTGGWAQRDGSPEQLAGLLGEDDIGGFEVAWKPLDEARAVSAQLGHLLLNRQRSDVLLLVIAGGVVFDGHREPYLETTQTDPARLESTAIHLSTVDKLLRQCRSSNCLLLLDVALQIREPAAAGQVGRTTLPVVSDPMAGHTVISATRNPSGADVGLISLAADALRSPAADYDGDLLITVEEFFRFVASGMSDRPGARPTRTEHATATAPERTILARRPGAPPVIDIMVVLLGVAAFAALGLVATGDMGPIDDSHSIGPGPGVEAPQILGRTYSVYGMGLLYEAVCLVGWSATIGKRLLGLQVGLEAARLERLPRIARRLGFIALMMAAYDGITLGLFDDSDRAVFVESMAQFGILLILGLSALLLALDRSRRTIWDRFAGTVVYRTTRPTRSSRAAQRCSELAARRHQISDRG
ncbi:MAG: RDD family protein [Acidimicrobiales bacterium]